MNRLTMLGGRIVLIAMCEVDFVVACRWVRLRTSLLVCDSMNLVKGLLSRLGRLPPVPVTKWL